MKFNRATPLAAGLALAIGAALYAAPYPATAEDAAKPVNPNFAKLDRNHDGVLTQDEVRHIRDYAKAFIEADENKDGKLDQAEFVKAESIHDRIITGKYVEDSILTAKVKAALLKEPDLKSLDVSVETSRGEVLLSGFVQDPSQKAKAMKVATGVNGVVAVKDAMLVRN
ncbi:MAG TPA: BON domain-containing protein [Burkholderiales bacterium]|nr:BON domain-containing protein [Burkholderiales bacterium]